MREISAVLAALAAAAGSVVGLAQQKLRQPKRETLFADAAWSVKKKAGGKGSGHGGFREPGSQLFVTVKVDQRHVEIWHDRGNSRRVAQVARFLTTGV